MRTHSTILIVYLLTFLFAGTLHAQWVQTSLDSVSIRCFAVSGSDLFASTSGGIYFSADDGTSWTRTSTWSNGLLAASGSNLFTAATDSIYRSTDNGINWTPVSAWNGSLNAFIASGTNVFAGGCKIEGPYCYSTVSISTDNGTSWKDIRSGLLGPYVTTLSVSGTRLLAGVGQSPTGVSGGVFQLAGNDTTWTWIGLTCRINCLAVLGTSLFAGLEAVYFGEYHGVFRTNDYGTTWYDINTGLSDSLVTCFAVSGSNVFAGTAHGIFLSTNNGTNWTEVNTGLTDSAITSLIVNGSYLFAGTGSGVWKRPLSEMIPNSRWVLTSLDSQSVTCLAVSKTNIYAGTDSGFFLSSNNGASWAQTHSAFEFMTDLTVSDSNIYAVVDYSQLMLSTDNGTSWNGISTAYVDLRAFAFRDSNFFMGGYYGIDRSTDNGITWSFSYSPSHVWDLAISGPNLIASTWSQVYLSTDNGASWTTVSTNMGFVRFGSWGSTLFAASKEGIYRSTDNGASWTSANTGLSDRVGLCFASSGSNIFVGTTQGVFLTTNNGTYWTSINDGLTDSSINTLTVSDSFVFAGTSNGVWKRPLSEMVPTSTIEIANGWNMVSLPKSVSDGRKEILFPSAISGAFAYNGSYQSRDTLTHGVGYWLKFSLAGNLEVTGSYLTAESIAVSPGWNMIGSLSAPLPVQSITIDPGTITTSNFFGYNGSYFVSDTIYPGKAYWVKVNQGGRLILSATSSSTALNGLNIEASSEQPPLPPNSEIPNTESATPKEFALEQNYPNPFNPATTFTYAIPERSKVTLDIYNIIGQIVATLVNGEQEPGYRSVEWNAANGIGSGMYFYRLAAASVAEPGRMFVQVRKMLVIK